MASQTEKSVKFRPREILTSSMASAKTAKKDYVQNTATFQTTHVRAISALKIMPLHCWSGYLDNVEDGEPCK